MFGAIINKLILELHLIKLIRKGKVAVAGSAGGSAATVRVANVPSGAPEGAAGVWPKLMIRW